MSENEIKIRQLYKERHTDAFARCSVSIFLMLIVCSWLFGDFSLDEFFSERRMNNMRRFMGELLPYPLQSADFEVEILASWVIKIMKEKGLEALLSTAAISGLAIVLAGAIAGSFGVFASRTLISSEPYSREPAKRRRLHWIIAVCLCRSLLIFMRAVPEYVWAFIFLAVLGPSAWPAVLAIGLHNGGVLGKLTADTIENLDPAPLEALGSAGLSRSQIAFLGVFPLSFPRFLLYFFYRWETCIRESTVLGLLGIVSLGYWIQDARARNHYDEMFFLVMLGALLVFLGDLLSTLAREILRRT